MKTSQRSNLIEFLARLYGLFFVVFSICSYTADAQQINPSLLGQLSAEQRRALLNNIPKGDDAEEQEALLSDDEITPAGLFGTRREERSDLTLDQICEEAGREEEETQPSAMEQQADERQFPGNATRGQKKPYSDKTGVSDQKMTTAMKFHEFCERRKREAAEQGKVRAQPFGYDLFASQNNSFSPASDIPVPSDFVVGPGDSIRVQLTGKENESHTLLVGRDGAINFPKLGPITVVGMKFNQMQSQIEQRVANDLIGVQANITMGRLRSIKVFVLGDARRPGSYTVSSLSTITHALYVSGGAKTTGSLRRIELKRAGRVVETLDLYDLLLKGDSSRDARLEPGDVVFIPPVGDRVTVEGEVKRPAIYELLKPSSMQKILELAGGSLASANLATAQLERLDPEKGRVLRALKLGLPMKQMISQDGDILRLRKVASAVEDSVKVGGHVKYPGIYPWTHELRLKEVLQAAEIRLSDLAEEAYLSMGAIERTDPITGIRSFLGFDIKVALAGGADTVGLIPKDVVLVFSRNDVSYLNNQIVKDTLLGKHESADCAGLRELRQIANSQRAIRMLRALSTEVVRDVTEKSGRKRQENCPRIFNDFPRALTFLLDRSVGLYGEIERPGLYPIAEFTTLSAALRATGGITREANSTNVEYASFAKAINTGSTEYRQLSLADDETKELFLTPGDVINFRPRYLDQDVGIVSLLGEVRFPGSYTISRGETLSQVITRAGGFTPSAYPLGTVFTRQSARKAEQESYKRAARDLQEAAVTALTSGALGTEGASTAQFLQTVIQRLEQTDALGRVVTQVDLAILTANPELDIKMEPGDVLNVPKQPRSISIAGQVLNPGSVEFQNGNSVEDYVRLAGGYAQGADEDRTFLVLPDGSARKISRSFWSLKGDDNIPAGSSIVVPRNAAPINGLVLTERVLGIFSNLAVSAAAIAVIGQ